MKIINSEERAKMVTGVKVVIFGPYGIGKTSLLKTLDESTTLCLDFEAGLLAVQDWKGDSTEIRTWNEARDIACLIGGPNPAVRADQAYSQKHYEHVCSKHKDLLSEVSKYRSIFIDSANQQIVGYTRKKHFFMLSWYNCKEEVASAVITY